MEKLDPEVSANIVNQLRELYELKKAGKISNEKFIELKKKLLYAK